MEERLATFLPSSHTARPVSGLRKSCGCAETRETPLLTLAPLAKCYMCVYTVCPVLPQNSLSCVFDDGGGGGGGGGKVGVRIGEGGGEGPLWGWGCG